MDNHIMTYIFVFDKLWILVMIVFQSTCSHCIICFNCHDYKTITFRKIYNKQQNPSPPKKQNKNTHTKKTQKTHTQKQQQQQQNRCIPSHTLVMFSFQEPSVPHVNMGIASFLEKPSSHLYSQVLCLCFEQLAATTTPFKT